MFVLARALTYATLFVGFLLVVVPAQLLARFGVPAPDGFGAQQLLGFSLVIGGAALAIACILTFVFVGRGTPAPFDPPRRLVMRGPYGVIRNPMYVGAGLVLVGVALFYESLAIVGYTAAFLLATHLLVVFYEEPTLRRTFGEEYDAYRQNVGRWWPHQLRTNAIASVAIAIAISVLVGALAVAPLYGRLDAAECHQAYSRARSRADSARVDLHPYDDGVSGLGVKRRCGEVRAVGASAVPGVTQR